MFSKSIPSIVGLDVGRGYAIACVYDANDPMTHDLPTFILKTKTYKINSDAKGAETLIGLGECFAMEPTGQDHYWWKQQLEAAGKLVLLISGIRIRNHARERGVMSKGDKEDAAAIASYTARHLDNGNSKAFLTFEEKGIEIKLLRSMIRGCQKQQTILINQLKARLSSELPERCKFTLPERDWGKPPGRMWEQLADDRMSEHSREDIELLLILKRREARLEVQLSQLIETIAEYQDVWERWGFNDRQIAAILSALYPIDQFFCEKGMIITHTKTKDGKRIKVNQSLRSIHRCLGYGRIKVQSGDSWKWGRTGDVSIRTSLYLWLDVMSMRRCLNRVRLFHKLGKPEDFDSWKKKQQEAWLEERRFRNLCEQWDPRCEAMKPLTKTKQRQGFLPWYDEPLIAKVSEFNSVTRPVAMIQLYYEFAHPGNKHDRILKTMPFMIRLLAKDLATWHVEHR